MSNLKEELLSIYNDVIGHLSFDEALLLFHLAKELKIEGAIVEIGSYQGKSTIFLAKGSQLGKKNKVYAIDPYKEFVGIYGGRFGPQDKDSFLFNIEKYGVEDIVELIPKTSEDTAKGWNIVASFVWIDGDHSYEAVSKDFHLWEPFLCSGGIIAFHDVRQDSAPAKVFDEMVCRNSKFINAGVLECIGYATKK